MSTINYQLLTIKSYNDGKERPLEQDSPCCDYCTHCYCYHFWGDELYVERAVKRSELDILSDEQKENTKFIYESRILFVH